MLIKELAKKLNTTPRAIRFYEEKGLLKPTKDPFNNYRVFHEKDAWRLQTIITLREVGMPIQTIRQVLEEIDQGDTEEVHYYLQLQRAVIFEEMIRLREMISTLDQMIENYSPDQMATWETCWVLAEQSRRTKEKREMWKDRWNFDKQANTYDEQVQRHPTDFDVHQDYDQGLDLVLDWTQPSSDEIGLEIGVGTGNLAGRFLSRGCHIKGIDQSKEMLKKCKEKYPELETRIGNFLAIPYPDQSFDYIVTSYALHHLTDEQKIIALEEMKRVLKPKGRICILDLMFKDEQKRQEYLNHWIQQGRMDVVNSIEDEYYADQSQLVEWLEKKQCKVKTKQINPILHLLYAE